MDWYNKALEAKNFLFENGIAKPEIGIILGTGLGGLVSSISIEKEINYGDIPHFPVSTVETHKGKLIYGTINGKYALAMQGRFHYYEGYSMQEITLPVRVMKLLGIKYLLISNACGGLNPNYTQGDLMLLTDHIDLLPDNPLTGKNIDEMGVRFPDMSEPYSSKINSLFEELASENNIKLHKGVYVALAGPNLETKAEYKFLRLIGADGVGMSTVPEVIVANHCSLPCAAISVITDMCIPDQLEKVSLTEIVDVAKTAEDRLNKLFVEAVTRLQ